MRNGPEFVRRVRDALAHLHDSVHLRRHALVALAPAANRASQERVDEGAWLRRELLEAVERLRPDLDEAGVGGPRRRHEILRLHFVEALDGATVQRRLSLSRSQYYADLAAAVEAAAFVLAQKWGSEDGLSGRDTPSGAPDRIGLLPAASLPRPLTSFVGREREMEELLGLLRVPEAKAATAGGVRLLTLTGGPGSGKTRLATEVASALSAESAVRFVDVAGLRDPALVLPAIAVSLGLRPGAEPDLITRMAGQVGEGRVLLVLDNFEHLLDAACDLTDLLGACAGVRALVTSRVPLRLSGEHEFPVLPLPVREGLAETPGAVAESAAVRLFVERARAVKPTFLLDGDNVAAIVEICRRVDGLPLGIELAAARVRVFTPREVAAALESRLAFLTQGPRDLPARQQTLRDAIAWSYELLDGSEQRLFRVLGVFAGGCTVDDVRQVVERTEGSPRDVLAGLEALVTKSLLQRDEPAGPLRFRMLESVREFAREQLERGGDAAMTYRAHASHFLNLASPLRQDIQGAHAPQALDAMEHQHDNHRAALEWAVAGGAPLLGLRLAYCLSFFWWLRGYLMEGRRWLEAVLAVTGDEPQAERADVLTAAGVFARAVDDNVGARNRLEESVRIFRRLGNESGLSTALRWLGMVLIDLDCLGEAQDALARSLDLARREAGRFGEAQSLAFLGELSRAAGDYAEGERLNMEIACAFREVGSPTQIGIALQNAGFAALRLGAISRARQHFVESLTNLPVDTKLASPVSCAGLAAWCAASGRFEEAARLFGAVAAQLSSTGYTLNRVDRRDHDHGLTQAHKALSAVEFETAWREGQALSFEAAVQYALQLANGEPTALGADVPGSVTSSPLVHPSNVV